MPKATGIVIPFLQNQRVVCKGKVEKTGIVQGAMIICDCCQEPFAPSAFEKHSGGTWHRPWQYIFVIETERNILYYRNQYEGRDPESSTDDPSFPVMNSKDPKEKEKEEMTLKDVVPQKKMKRNTCWSTDDSDIENTWVSDRKKVKIEPSSPDSSPFWLSATSRTRDRSKKSYDESKEDQELEVALKKYNRTPSVSASTSRTPSCPSTPRVSPSSIQQQNTINNGEHSNLTSCPTSPEFVNAWSAPKPCDFATALHKLVQEDLQMQHDIHLYTEQSDFQFTNNSGLCDFAESFFSSWNDNDNVQSLLL